MKRTQARLLSGLLLVGIPTAPLLMTTGCLCGGIEKHDQLIALDGECDEAWANIDAQYQRRMDLLPNMVKLAKKVAEHEKDTLTEVTKARASATQIQITQADLSDPEKMEKFHASQQQVAQSFGKLMHIAEKYPELKGDQGFMKLMDQLEGTENRILIARKKYNKAVKNYNTGLKKFGGKVLDKVTGDVMFEPRTMYKAQAGAEVAPDLDLD
jgi:LemA protein